MKLPALLTLVSLVFTCNCFAAKADGIHADEIQLGQLSWLAGCWKGTGLGGEVNECWVQSADKFTGVFQMTIEGQQKFSEIVMVAELDGVLAMRVKHFDAAFNQWASDGEVGVTFPFVAIGENFIQFEGLRYELIEDVCHVTLDMKKAGEVHQVSFVFTRD
jgi:hypothetical protein